jgi:hypothetical protein
MLRMSGVNFQFASQLPDRKPQVGYAPQALLAPYGAQKLFMSEELARILGENA